MAEKKNEQKNESFEELDYKIELIKNLYDLSWDYAKTQTDMQYRTYLQLFVVFLGIGITISLGVISGNLSIWCILAAIVAFDIAFLYINRVRLLPDELGESFKRFIDGLKKLI